MNQQQLLAKIKQATLEGATELHLANNELTALPPEVGQLTNLKELDLKGNPLLGE